MPVLDQIARLRTLVKALQANGKRSPRTPSAPPSSFTRSDTIRSNCLVISINDDLDNNSCIIESYCTVPTASVYHTIPLTRFIFMFGVISMFHVC